MFQYLYSLVVKGNLASALAETESRGLALVRLHYSDTEFTTLIVGAECDASGILVRYFNRTSDLSSPAQPLGALLSWRPIVGAEKGQERDRAEAAEVQQRETRIRDAVKAFVARDYDSAYLTRLVKVFPDGVRLYETILRVADGPRVLVLAAEDRLCYSPTRLVDSQGDAV